MNYERKTKTPFIYKLLWVTLALIAAVLILDWLGYTPEDVTVRRPETAPVVVIPTAAPVVLPPTQAPVIVQPEWVDELATALAVTAVPATATPGMSLVPWARPITKEQYDLCKANRLINPVCEDYLKANGEW